MLAGPWHRVAAAAEGPDVDLVVSNANVYTVDSRAPKAEAFAVKGGRFTAVGRNSEIRGLIAKGTQTFDARRMTIVPGFIDTHNHATGTGSIDPRSLQLNIAAPDRRLWQPKNERPLKWKRCMP
jgi:predicted amidohydrolase YtcJ